MVKYIESGNIFKIEGVYNFAHGCNCVGAMGKGIALQFRQMFPSMYLKYRELCESGHFNLGDIFVYQYEKGSVFILATQKSWKTGADLSAIETAFRRMLEFASNNSINQVALPKIGAGLGKLDWHIVKSTINKIASEYDSINVFIVENFNEE